jgi:hypothetical protein
MTALRRAQLAVRMAGKVTDPRLINIRVGHWGVQPSARRLFPDEAPPGFHYRENFITASEEASLVDAIRHVEFATFEMHGVIARRRVAFFGASYERGPDSVRPLPEFLIALRETVAAWAAVEPTAFAMALINEYRPGAPIGWHRDAPQYELVAGVSLLSACRMRFRPYVRPDTPRSTVGERRLATHAVILAPRSAYLMTGESRHAYEHQIPAGPALRYSITFRTMRP